MGCLCMIQGMCKQLHTIKITSFYHIFVITKLPLPMKNIKKNMWYNCGTMLQLHQAIRCQWTHSFKCIQQLDATITRYYNYTVAGPKTLTTSLKNPPI